MAKYYIGNLFDYGSVSANKIFICCADDKVLPCSDSDFMLRYGELSYDERKKIDYCFSHNPVTSQIKLKDIMILLNKMYHDKKFTIKENLGSSSTPIIYEIIEDNTGNLYGKEILSGALFPIITKETKKFEVDTHESMVFLGKGEGYLYQEPNTDFYTNGTSKFHLKDYKTYDNKMGYYAIREHSYNPISLNSLKTGYLSYLTYQYQFLHDNVELGRFWIKEQSPASEIDIEKYQKLHSVKKSLFRRRNYFVDLLVHESKNNVYKEEIIPKKEEIIKQEVVDDETRLMEEIEYLLLKLKDYNNELYNKYNTIYQNLFIEADNKLKTVTINKSYLESLKANIMLCFNFNKNSGMSLMDYLNNLKNEYLNNFMNEEKLLTKITIPELDKIMELFLKTQNDYNPINRRIIFRNISLIYLLEIYENKDTIDYEILKKSYVNQCLKSIILCIISLMEDNVITCDYLITLNDDIMLSDVIDVIKNIKFKKNEVKKLSI